MAAASSVGFALLIGCGGAGGGNSSTSSSSSTSSTSSTSGATGVPDLGAGADMHGYVPFPLENVWNQPVDRSPVDPNSANLIASIGLGTTLHPDFGANFEGGPFGIPYIVVPSTQATVPMTFQFADESDPGPYPIPRNAPIEGGSASTGDRHVLVVDRDSKLLYETYSSFPQNGGASWQCGSGAKFNLVTGASRPAGWTSADAAGLPIFPGLVRYDEVVILGQIRHALRFTAANVRRAYVFPARHLVGSNTSVNLPPMGMRVRLKANFDVSSFSPHVQVILNALKTYGMFLADIGSNWYISGAPDSRWDDNELNALKTIAGSNFEVIQMGTITGP